jgi:NAD(P)-dependent dehydrogenase (short-subunit alcohol dehydrogenase family)
VTESVIRGRNRCLVVGANRGIGLALVENLLQSEATGEVIAVHRPATGLEQLESLAQRFGDRLQLWPLDFTRQASLEEFSTRLRDTGGGIDLAIHAAGMLHQGDIQPEKSVSQCRVEHLRQLFEVNSIYPLMVAQALLAAQSRRQAFTFAALSAMVGSIGDNRLGGWYGYRASKAALNQFVRTLSIECRGRFPRAVIVAIHPGTTDTALSRPFQRNVQPGKLYAPEQSATRILNVLDALDESNSGQFFNWDGRQIPW